MKILWLSPTFLHPTTRGGQIRTLETLRRLHRRHEIHYVGLFDGRSAEATGRAAEYCTRAYPAPHTLTPKGSPRFWYEAASGFFSPVPALVSRKRSPRMQAQAEELLRSHRFDRIVCDFLTPVANLPPGAPYVIFQHNVEHAIWRRYADQAPDPVRKAYFQLQARRVFAYERDACRRAVHVIAVSERDAAEISREFGLKSVSWVPTGVDADFFSPPPHQDARKRAGLVFVGSMDWMPNIDGARWFVREILPAIRKRRPACPVAIVGRSPVAEIRALADDPLITVTGTVEDVRPWLWAAAAAIVPLRIGGGTRLKIYEAMGARVPVVSTTIGAEGLEATAPREIRIADSPAAFAAECLALLENPEDRMQVAEAGAGLVRSKFSWDRSSARFEEILAGLSWPPIP